MTELSPAARQALQQARASFTPSREERDAVCAAVEARAATAADARVSAAPHAQTALGSTGLVRWLSAGLLGAASLAGMLYLRPSNSLPAMPAAHSGKLETVAAKGAVSLPAAVVSEFARDPAPADAPALQAAPNATPERPRISARSKPTRAKATRTPRSETAASRSQPEAVTEVAPQSAHGRTGVASTSPSARDVAADTSPKADSHARESAPSPAAGPAPVQKPELAEPSPDTLSEELLLLRNAQAALDRNDAAQALSLLERHTMRFPKGVLRQERLAAQVAALCSLGRVDEAKDTARQLARVAPNSPHLLRLRGSCASDARP